MSRYTSPVPYALDGNGAAQSGYKLYFRTTGGGSLKSIYSNSGLTTATSNPQIADSNGQFSGDIFLDGVYEVEYTDENDVVIWTKDPVGDVISGQFELWVSDKTYNIPDKVVGSDDAYYESKTDGNLGNDPISFAANWAVISFVNDGVVSGVTNINDSNGNEAVIIGATASAVNEVSLTNAATGDKVKIQATGEAAGAGLSIEATGTNAGIDLIAKGTEDLSLSTDTGYITVSGGASGEVQGAYVNLDTPVVVATTVTNGVWTGVSLSSYANAKIAKLRFHLIDANSVVGRSINSVWCRKTGSGLGTINATLVMNQENSENTTSLTVNSYGSAQFEVSLNGSQSFDYYINNQATSIAVVLVGYYV